MGFGGRQADGDDCVYLIHEGIVRRTRDASLYRIHGRDVWLPRSAVRDSNNVILVVNGHVARQKGLKSDW